MPATHRLAPIRTAALACALLCASCASLDQGARTPVTPQRPTLSSNTNTTAAGTFELETGIAYDPGDRFGTPSTLKLGLDERSEAYLGFEPLIVLDRPGRDTRGPGDLVLGYRRRFLDADRGQPAAAWLLAAKLPTADDDEGLGTGRADLTGALALDGSLGSWSTTGYLQGASLGDPTGGRLWQTAAAVAIGHEIASELGGFGELAWIHTREIDDEELFTTLGVTWSRVPGRVLDAGIVLGLNDDAPDFQLVLGTTVNLGPIAR